MAPASVIATLLPEVIATVEKLLDASSNVILFPDPAASVVVPVTANVPLSVIAPLAVIPNVPETVDAPKMMAPASVIATLLPLVIATVEKLLAASSNVILFPDPAASVVTPVTANVPLSVIAPAAVMPNVPEIVDAPKSNALTSFSVTLPA